eukprot:1341359-Rhodomonas_salina.1
MCTGHTQQYGDKRFVLRTGLRKRTQRVQRTPEGLLGSEDQEVTHLDCESDEVEETEAAQEEGGHGEREEA